MILCSELTSGCVGSCSDEDGTRPPVGGSISASSCFEIVTNASDYHLDTGVIIKILKSNELKNLVDKSGCVK